MSRPRQRKSLGFRIFYCCAVVLILGAWIYAFRSYFAHYDSLHPEITWAVPWVQVDMIEADGIFLWNEATIASPRAGAVRLPCGPGPVRVAKGEIVARVSSGGVIADVRAPQEGYFVAGVDGEEGKWRYSQLWPGTRDLPHVNPVRLLKEGTNIRKGDLIGKIIPQPQDLRFIGYVNLTANLEEKLASNRVMVKMDSLDTPSRAHVRVYEVVGHIAKVYLNMPWFPPELLLSRNYRLIIEIGATSGVTVPESAVVMRDGKYGAFVLKGADAHFTEVQGRIIDGSRFLVTKGIRLGDAVIVHAYAAREGRVKLW